MLLHEHTHAATDHGLLAEQQKSLTTEGLTDISHLLRSDVLDLDHEHLRILLENLVELLEVKSFLLSGRHDVEII